MQPKLGLCCIALDNQTKFRTMTLKRFKELGEQAAMDKLADIYRDNIQVTIQNILYCSRLGLAHYRLSSSIFPVLSAFDKSWRDLPNSLELKNLMAQVGPLANRLGISLSMHPDQYICLGSPHQQVRERSINELNYLGDIMDCMGISGTMCLHVSNGSQPPLETKARFDLSAKQLDNRVLRRLCLENEDKGCWNCETLFNNFGAEYPLVYDNLHDSCNPSSNRDWCRVFTSTWPVYTPIFHWSEGEAEDARSHADYYSKVPDCVKNMRHVIWECEVKMKDRAIKKALSDFFLDNRPK